MYTQVRSATASGMGRCHSVSDNSFVPDSTIVPSASRTTTDVESKVAEHPCAHSLDIDARL